jgi:hypothetical protein
VYKVIMSRWSKSFSLILILIALIANVSILAIKPVSGKSNTAPTISIVYPTNETVFNVSIEGVYFKVQYETNDTLSWVGYSIDGGSNVTVTGNSTTEHDFDFGYNTLTLYANDTDGNWAIPQTVTYLANFYPDTTSAPSPTSTTTTQSTPSPTPSVPEFPCLAILPLLLSLFSVALVIRHRKAKYG